MAAGENTTHMLILKLKLKITKENIQQEPNTHYLPLSLRIQTEQTAFRYQHEVKCDHRRMAWLVIHTKAVEMGAGWRPQLQYILTHCFGIVLVLFHMGT